MNDGLFETTKQCIACNKDFPILKVKSSAVRVEKRDTDNCPYYRGINPLFYDFHVCPICGTVFTDRHKIIIEKRRVVLIRTFSNLTDKKEFFKERNIADAIRLAKLSLITSQILNSPSTLEAGACLRIAWFYRSENNKIKEEKYIKLAIEHYSNAFEKGEEILGHAEIMGLLGELNYRVKDYKNTKVWFGSLINLRDGSNSIRKGKSRWNDIKEDVNKNLTEKVYIRNMIG